MRAKIVCILIAALIATGIAEALDRPRHLSDAIRSQRRIAKNRPNDPGAYNDLGNLLTLAGQREAAEEAYRHALSLAPEHADTHYNLALLLRLEGRNRSALDELKKAVSLDPKDAWGHYQLGVMLEERGKVSKATDHFARAFVLDGSLAEVESNPQVLDSRLTTRAMMVAYHERITQFEIAPRQYAQPKRITRLLVPEVVEVVEGQEAGEVAGEAEAPPAKGKKKRGRRQRSNDSDEGS